MYGKLFAQMYDGTLGTRGPWEALVTFQQMIILSDEQGVVDMTAEAISRRTTLPLDIILKGIAELEQPDDKSRTPDEDGRRILRLSEDRDWGWRITNYGHYRKIRSQAERREYMRQYQQKYRARKQAVNNVSEINQSSKQYAVKTLAPPPVDNSASVDNPVDATTTALTAPPLGGDKSPSRQTRRAAYIKATAERLGMTSFPGESHQAFAERVQRAATT